MSVGRHTSPELRVLQESESAEALLQKYGQNSNSFFGLYPGFRRHRFTAKNLRGIQFYFETPNARIGAAEPVTQNELRLQLLVDFFNKSKINGKAALLLPVSQEFSHLCQSAGMRSIQIGTEPYFELEKYFSEEPLHREALHSARALSNKKAQVHEIEFNKIASGLFKQLEEIRIDWLNSRKMPPLGFLNRVEPWVLSGQKKYFYLEKEKNVLAFVAGIPIPARGGWYLVDVFRKSDSPAGSIELLLVEAMRQLHRQGYQEVSLGVAPLAGLDPNEFGVHSVLFSILQKIYDQWEMGYGFKSLHEFKLKLRPTCSKPAYLVTPGDQGLLSTLRGLAQVYFPRGMVYHFTSGIFRQTTQWITSGTLQTLMSPSVVFCEAPRAGREFISRTKTCWFLACSWILLFLIYDDGHGMLRRAVFNRYAFSWEKLIQRWPHWNTSLLLLAPPFFHSNLFHLSLNLLLLVLFMVPVELLLGQKYLLRCFALGALFSNLLTLLVLKGFQVFLRSPLIDETFRSTDLGASLGIFTCAGALMRLTKRPTLTLLGITGAISIVAVLTSDLLQFNHLFAMLLGVLLSERTLAKATIED